MEDKPRIRRTERAKAFHSYLDLRRVFEVCPPCFQIVRRKAVHACSDHGGRKLRVTCEEFRETNVRGDLLVVIAWANPHN